MNFLKLFLTIYFVALSIMPCSDAVNEKLKENDISYSANGNKEDDHSKGDACSPLCFCNCCRIAAASVKIDTTLNYPKQIITYFSKKILFAKNDFAYLVYDQIWQPPKI